MRINIYNLYLRKRRETFNVLKTKELLFISPINTVYRTGSFAKKSSLVSKIDYVVKKGEELILCYKVERKDLQKSIKCVYISTVNKCVNEKRDNKFLLTTTSLIGKYILTH